jgi:hypothetical protein
MDSVYNADGIRYDTKSSPVIKPKVKTNVSKYFAHKIVQPTFNNIEELKKLIIY